MLGKRTEVMTVPKNSKTKRDRPADNVPASLIKDAARPNDVTEVVCEGDELKGYLTELENDKSLDFDLK